MFIDPVTSEYTCKSHMLPAHRTLLSEGVAELLGVWDPHPEFWAHKHPGTSEKLNIMLKNKGEPSKLNK